MQTRRSFGYLTATMALVLGLATIVPAALRCYAYAEAEGNALLDVNGTDFRSRLRLTLVVLLLFDKCHTMWPLCYPDLGRVRCFGSFFCSCMYIVWDLAASLSCQTALQTCTVLRLQCTILRCSQLCDSAFCLCKGKTKWCMLRTADHAGQ